MKLADRVRCSECLWRDDCFTSVPGRVLRCDSWRDAQTGETVADLALQLRLARARREGCRGCALWRNGICFSASSLYLAHGATITCAGDFCSDWQPGQPAPKEAPDA